MRAGNCSREGQPDARCYLHRSNAGVFCSRDCLCARLRAAEVRRAFNVLANILLLVVCILVFGYLVMALLWPEKF
ncbi:MAG: K(+)-transporting ATPase subunit F [Acidobacteria bacterium]|nr:MAG: K(+)-transporting ATPase subunit F [Acidobacteriota bacterium]